MRLLVPSAAEEHQGYAAQTPEAEFNDIEPFGKEDAAENHTAQTHTNYSNFNAIEPFGQERAMEELQNPSAKTQMARASQARPPINFDLARASHERPPINPDLLNFNVIEPVGKHDVAEELQDRAAKTHESSVHDIETMACSSQVAEYGRAQSSKVAEHGRVEGGLDAATAQVSNFNEIEPFGKEDAVEVWFDARGYCRISQLLRR